QREAVVRHHLQGWTLAELAAHLGRSEPAVAGLLHRGLDKLRTLLREEEELMTTESTKSSERDRRLGEELAQDIRAAAAGQAPDHEEFLARHPDLTAELRTFLANRQLIERLAKPLRAAAPSGPYLGKLRYFGDYELLQEIARGGMGVVYKARQVSL